jgi:subtilisin family serine protease
MYKSRLKLFGLLFILLLSCCISTRDHPQSNPPGKFGYLPKDLPRNLTEGELTAQAKDQTKKIWGFIGHNYDGKILDSLSLSFLATQSFDQETKWPKNHLPDGFDPVTWLNNARNPGLGVRQLTQEGITGRGISIALIDKPIRSSHSEFTGRMSYIEIFNDPGSNVQWHFHGIACASILAGKTIGVAPGVHLYYFAVPDNGENFLNYSLAIEQLLVINRNLKPEDKIRLVSISDGAIVSYAKEWEAAKAKLKAEGVEFLYAGPDVFSGFAWGGCPPFLDRERPEYYEISSYLKNKGVTKGLIVPADYRTTASNYGDEAYVYWGTSGLSWAIPYVAGLSALAWQVNPRLRYSEIRELLIKTAGTKPNGVKVLMPLTFIDSVKNLAN